MGSYRFGRKIMTTVVIPVQGMSCDGCSASVTRALKAVAGVERADVSLQEKQASVTYDPKCVDEQTLREAIEDAGFEAM